MPAGFNVIRSSGKAALIVFVHGFRGGDNTWRAWEALLQEDDEFPADAAAWSYTSRALSKSPTIWEAAEQLRTELRVRLSSYQRLILVGHSLGGLVIRAAVVRSLQQGCIEECERLAHIVTLATPNDGVQLAAILGRFNRQIAALAVTGEVVQELRTEWIDRVYAPEIRPGEERTKLKIPLTTVVGLDDEVVSAASAASFFRHPTPATVPGDHVSMKDPSNREATVYLLIKDIAERTNASRVCSQATIESVSRLTSASGGFALEIVLDNTASCRPLFTKEIAVGGTAALNVFGASAFCIRALFALEVDGGVEGGEGSQPLRGAVRADNDEFVYRFDGHLEHIDGAPRATWEGSIRFPALLRCPAGEKLQVRLTFRRAARRLIESERRGTPRGSWSGGVPEVRSWVEVQTDEGVLRQESDDDAWLKWIVDGSVPLPGIEADVDEQAQKRAAKRARRRARHVHAYALERLDAPSRVAIERMAQEAHDLSYNRMLWTALRKKAAYLPGC